MMSNQGLKFKTLFLIGAILCLFFPDRKVDASIIAIATDDQLTAANHNVQPGDIVEIAGGTYASQIVPAKSGTSGNYITYRAANDATVNIRYPNDYGKQADLSGRSYIIIDGVHFSDAGFGAYHVDLDGGGNNIIRNCTFTNSNGAGINLSRSSYNKIQNNTFNSGDCGSTSGDYSGCPSDHIVAYGNAHHNLIEDNTFNNAAHYALLLNEGPSFNVVKNNLIDNPWHAGFQVGNNSTAGQNLFEENIIRDCGTQKADNPDYRARVLMADYEQFAFQLFNNSEKTIVRRNILFNNGSVSFGAGSGSTVRNNRIYNNTFDQHLIGLTLNNYDGGTDYPNYFKNNHIGRSSRSGQGIWENNSGQQQWIGNNFLDTGIWYNSISGGISSIQTAYPLEFQNNTSFNPGFVSMDTRNYTLQTTSSLIDAGAFLTTASNNGSNSTSLTVADAGYFIDGWGIVPGDAIKLQNGQESTITAVNYSTNQITLASPISWTSGMGVALDFEGSAPDIGAKEYGNAEDLQAPAVPTGLNVR